LHEFEAVFVDAAREKKLSKLFKAFEKLLKRRFQCVHHLQKKLGSQFNNCEVLRQLLGMQLARKLYIRQSCSMDLGPQAAAAAGRGDI
jgi:hypothetical protein